MLTGFLNSSKIYWLFTWFDLMSQSESPCLIYWGTLETHHFTFSVSSTWLIWGCFLHHFLSSCKKPWFAMISICSCCSFWRTLDVSVFNNCHLTNVNLIQFKKNKQFYVLTNGKTQKFSEIIVLVHSHSQGFFAKLTSVLKFQTSITDGRRPRMSWYFCL